MSRFKTLCALGRIPRLAARLDEIEALVAGRRLGRMEAADMIRDEVAEACGEPEDVEGRLLLRRAHLRRAHLYRASAGATPIDAATALLLAAEQEAALPPDESRAAEIVPVAAETLDALRPLKSRRRAFRVLAALTSAVAAAPSAGVGAARLVEAACGLLEKAPTSVPASLIGATLDRLLAVVQRDASLGGRERDALVARLLPYAVRTGDAGRALSFFPGAGCARPEDLEALARLAVEAGRLDDASMRIVEAASALGPDSRCRLERALRDRAAVPPGADAARLGTLEDLNRRAARWFGASGWPWLNLVRIEASRGRVVAATAAFARLAQDSGDLADAPSLVAPLLFAAGWRRTAAELGDAPTAVLVRAQLALDAHARDVGDDLLADLERLFVDDAVAGPLAVRARHLRGRLALAAGRTDEAVLLLERALAHDDRDPAIAGDFVEALVVRGDHDRARAFIGLALEGGETPRLLELAAATAERQGRVGDACDLLVRALEKERTADVEGDPRVALLSEIEGAYAALAPARTGPSPFLARLRADAETAASAERDALTNVRAVRKRAAHLALKAGKYETARRLLERLSAAEAADPVLAACRARAELACGRAEDAVRTLDPHAASGDAEISGIRGRALLRLGRHAEAAADLEAAAAANFDESGAAWLEAVAGAEGPAAAIRAAEDALRDGVASGSSTVPAQRVRARLLEAADDLAGAMGACVECLDSAEDEDMRARYGRLAITLAARRPSDDADAAKTLDRAVRALAGATSPAAKLWRAVAALACGRVSTMTAAEVDDALLAPGLDAGPGGSSRAAASMLLGRR